MMNASALQLLQTLKGVSSGSINQFVYCLKADTVQIEQMAEELKNNGFIQIFFSANPCFYKNKSLQITPEGMAFLDTLNSSKNNHRLQAMGNSPS